MSEKKSTKEQIIDSALNLFSEKGFDGVGVDEIANSVGIKGPSLYKHFKGKEALLEEIIQIGEFRYEQNFGSEDSLINRVSIPESIEQLISGSLKQIEFTLHDPYVIKLRKLFTIEQFRNKRLSELATKHNISGLVKMYTYVFNGMKEKGLIKNYETDILAFEYISPVTVLIQMIDRQPELETEILKKIKAHFEHFVDVYGLKN